MSFSFVAEENTQDNNFNVPEGIYKMKLIDAKQVSLGNDNKSAVQLEWEIMNDPAYVEKKLKQTLWMSSEKATKVSKQIAQRIIEAIKEIKIKKGDYVDIGTVLGDSCYVKIVHEKYNDDVKSVFKNFYHKNPNEEENEEERQVNQGNDEEKKNGEEAPLNDEIPF